MGKDQPKAARADLGIHSDGGAREYHKQVFGDTLDQRTGGVWLKQAEESAGSRAVGEGDVIVVFLVAIIIAV